MSDRDEDLRRALAAAADQSSPCQRVLRYYDNQHVAVRPADFYQALKAVDCAVVRIDIEGVAPIDCRHNEDGGVEFATDLYDGDADRSEFLDKISAADTVSVIHTTDSEFEPAGEDDREVRADGGRCADSTEQPSDDVLGTDEVEAFVEELYLAGYRNHHELGDVDPGYEYAIQQLCSEMSGPQVPALTKEVECRAMQRAQERFDEQVARDDQLTRLDCPNCEDAVDARYLGTASTDEHDGHIVGWECTECDAELQEHVDQQGRTFDLRVVGEQSSTATEQRGDRS